MAWLDTKNPNLRYSTCGIEQIISYGFSCQGYLNTMILVIQCAFYVFSQ